MTDFNKKRRKDRDENITLELTKKNLNVRIVAFILFAALALTAFGYALWSFLSTESGWKEIEANNTSELNCSSDFVFMYNVGASGISATAENKAITLAYTDAVLNGYQLFTNDQGYDGVNNVYYINQHPNEEIEVHEALYQAFSQIQEYQDRNIYLAPVYMQYDDIFFAGDDSETADYDPYQNEEIAAYYKEVASYANNVDAINIELLGGNKIRLNVSEEYLKYAEENYITSFIDFTWLKNAFVVDYLADTMIEKGYTLGTISSYDGFSRNLDDSGTSYSFNIYDMTEDSLYGAGIIQYTGAQSIVFMHNYPITSMDYLHYYEMKNGEIRTAYLDVADGICKSSLNNLVSYSEDMGCAEVLLQTVPVYVTDTFNKEAITELKTVGIHSVYCENHVIYYNDSSVEFTELYNRDDVTYTVSYVNE